jgi:RND superfamily putative drug exporter
VSPTPPDPGRSGLRHGRALLLAAVAVLTWLVVGAVAGPFAGSLAEVQKNDNASFLPDDAESTRALALERGFEDTDALPTLVVYEREGGLTPQDRAAIEADVQRFAQVEGLLAPPSPPVPSEDGEAAQVVLLLDGTDIEALPAAVEEIRGVLDEPGGPEAYVTGVGGLSADLFEVFGAIDTTLIVATASVVIVILLVVYRSPVLWVLPLLSVALAFSLSAGVIYQLADNDVLTLNGQSQGILTVLVFGAGTDYALLLIARYREELHKHRTTSAAMAVALRGSVPAIAASAATVVLGLLCLLFSELNSNRGLGPVSAIGIVAAFLAMTTLLPALLLLGGRAVFWPRVPRFVEGAAVDGGVWERIAGLVGRRSRRVAVLSGAALLLLSLGITQLQASGLSTADSFIGEVESVQGQEVLGRHFSAGTGSPATVVGPAEESAELRAVVEDVPGVDSAAFATAAPGADDPPTVDGRVLVRAVLSAPADSAEARATVERLREAVDVVPGEVLVGGFTAFNVDVQASSQRDRVVIIPMVLLVILLVLCLLLRSIVAPLLLVATVVLSFAATLGVCAVVFRHVFGFAGADSAFPLFAFVFLVALGIDYNIFLMTRVREETLRSGTGTLRGLALTGGVITSAGVVLAATFSVLGVLPLVFLAELGFAVAFGVLLDTFVVRSLLVPALTLEIGGRIWWPSALSRPQRSEASALLDR